MTFLLYFLYKILPCSVLTYTSVRGEDALLSSVVLHSTCTALVNVTLQLPQLPECIFSCSEPWAGLRSWQDCSAPSTRPMQSCKVHPTSLAAFTATLWREIISGHLTGLMWGGTLSLTSIQTSLNKCSAKAVQPYTAFLCCLCSETAAGVKRGSKQTTVTQSCF